MSLSWSLASVKSSMHFSWQIVNPIILKLYFHNWTGNKERERKNTPHLDKIYWATVTVTIFQSFLCHTVYRNSQVFSINYIRAWNGILFVFFFFSPLFVYRIIVQFKSVDEVSELQLIIFSSEIEQLKFCHTEIPQ